MRLRDRSGRAVFAAAVLTMGACTASSSGTRPVAALASSLSAATDFEAIRDAWRKPDTGATALLRSQIETFLTQHPTDGLVPLAHVQLAFVALRERDFAAADREIARGQSLPPGSTRDLWMVARARRLRMQGEPEVALELLRPLVGKNVDPLTRSEFEDELTATALATHREYEAISYMDAWLRASTEDEKPATVAAVTAIVDRLPKDVLVRSLQAMRTQRASFGYGVDIERILAQRLVQIATTSGDAELARILLDPEAGALVLGGDAGAELGELAISRRGLNVVDGRTIGLLLPTESPELRDESADVLRGVMWALGLPTGVRTPTSFRSAGVASAASVPATRRCTPPRESPPLDEPSPADRVRLTTRDDAGSADRTEVSLDELAGEGASVVIAGLDPQTSARALRWGKQHGVAIVALVPPEPAGDAAALGPSTADAASAPFGFVLGEARADVVEVLEQAAPALRTDGVVPVADASEVAASSAPGARGSGLTLLPPVSCEASSKRAGDPRFPIADWQNAKTRAWLVSGSPVCATDLIGELSAARARGLVALTLEAAALPPHGSGLRIVSAAAGVIPETGGPDSGDDELRRFAATFGTVTWWTALGRDATTLARAAVRQMPTDLASGASEVSERRIHASKLLAGARAPLWTTESTAFGVDRTMRRTVCAVDAPGR